MLPAFARRIVVPFMFWVVALRSLLPHRAVVRFLRGLGAVRGRGRGRRAGIAVVSAACILAALLPAPAALAVVPPDGPVLPATAGASGSGPVVALPPSRRTPVKQVKPAPVKPSPVVAPSAVTRQVAVGVSAARVAGTPLSVAAGRPAASSGPSPATGAKAAASGGGTGAPAPASVSVSTLDPSAVTAFGGQKLGFTVQRADGVEAAGGDVDVTVDYSGIAGAYGGGYGRRLQVLAYPGCALTTPQVAECRRPVVVPSVNDPKHQSLTVTVNALPEGAKAPSAAQPSTGPSSPAKPSTAPSSPAKPSSARTRYRPGKPPALVHAASKPSSAASSAAPSATARPAAKAAAVVFAVASAPSGDSGDGNFQATSLKPTGKWAVGQQSGDFSYSYPVAVPPSSAGAVPPVQLTYSSQAVDGFTSGQNRQAPVGTGWDLPMPFIERRFTPCDLEGRYAGSLCFGGENAVISLNGHVSSLLPLAEDSDDTPFVMQDDAGYKIERIFSYDNDNGDGIGHHWKVTTPDGTQYWFGLENPDWQAEKNDSTLVQPVVSDDQGPCQDGGDNVCWMAYRWNLAYVVDRDGNIQSYRYGKATYRYHSYTGDDWDYDGDGWLTSIEYGQRTDTVKTAPAPQQVDFAYRWRCETWLPEGQCEDAVRPDAEHPDWYPDIPFDITCASVGGTEICPNGPPSALVYYSLRRLDGIYPKYRKADGSYQTVSTTFFDHGYMFGTADWSSAAMVIYGLWTVGSDDSTRLPATTFDYTQKPNQWSPDDGDSNLKPRLENLTTPIGGQTQVTYGQPDPCSTAQANLPEWQNASDCYKIINGDGSSTYSQKWLVTKVESIDRDGSPTQSTSFAYSANTKPARAAPAGQGAGWHSDGDFVGPLDQQGWTQFRGYQQVKVTKSVAGGKPATQEYTFYRGLKGDFKSRDDLSQKRSGTISTAAYPGSPAPASSTYGRTLQDVDGLRGLLAEHRSLDATGREQLADQHDYSLVTTPFTGPDWADPRDRWDTVHTASRPVETSGVELFTTNGGQQRTRTHQVAKTYDSYGRAVTATDGGDAVTGTGASCTWTTWATNTGDHILDKAQRVVKGNAACGAAEPAGTAVIGRTDTLYDGSTTSGTVTKGHPTDVVKWTGPAGPPSAISGTRSTYDAAGRVTGTLPPDQYAAANPAWKTTAYDTSTGPVTSTAVTDPSGATTTTTLDPGTGQKLAVTDANGRTTTQRYDVLGRLVAVRRPGDTYDTVTYAYDIPDDRSGPARISTTRFSAPGQSVTSYTYVDALGRNVQTETASPNAGKRVFSGKRYDAAGNESATVTGIVVTGTPGTAISGWYDQTWDAGLPSTTKTGYDEFDRPVTKSVYGAGQGTPVSTTTTAYDGFATTTTPPSNSGAGEPDVAPTTVTNDLFKHPVIRTQGALTTTYTYDVDGNITSLTSPAHQTSTYTYDWLGHRTGSATPDSGTSYSDYYPSGALRHTKDAKGQDLYFDLDVLGRTRGIYAGTGAAGTPLSQTVYDGAPLGSNTPLKGSVTSRTSYDGGNAYTETYGYDARYRVVRTEQTIPSVANSPVRFLAGTYATTATFDDADRQIGVGLPAAGGLPAETVTAGYVGGYATTLSGTMGSYVTSTSYTDIGQLQTQTLGAQGPGSVTRTLAYDVATGRLTAQGAVATQGGGTVRDVQKDTFTYTGGGDITKITDGLAANPQQQCFAYDTYDRLVAAVTSSSADAAGSKAGAACTPDTTGLSPYNESYTYDGDGDITALASSGVASSFAYGGNQALGVTGGPHAVTSVTKAGATTTYTYDANGQLTQRTSGGVTTTYSWNAQQRLASVTAGSAASTFVDGPSGGRWIRQTPTETVAFLAGQELHLPAGAASASAVTGVRYYSHSGHEVAARSSGRNGGTYWLLTDRSGTAGVLVDASSGNDLHRRYLPFGGDRAAAPVGTPTDQGWIGQIQDPDTGLDYLNARYYDPGLTRFISVDPVTDTSVAQGQNPYWFGRDNPTQFSDPSGLYVVKPGDSWYTIAALQGISNPSANNWSAVRAIFGPTLNALAIGQYVYVPAVDGGGTPASTPSAQPAAYSTPRTDKDTPPDIPLIDHVSVTTQLWGVITQTVVYITWDGTQRIAAAGAVLMVGSAVLPKIPQPQLAAFVAALNIAGGLLTAWAGLGLLIHKRVFFEYSRITGSNAPYEFSFGYW